MPRYIDADKFIAHLKDELKECEIPLRSRANGKGIAYGTALGLKSAISFADTLSTADVVPKSEVDLYRKQVDELEDELASTYDKLENAKAEIERLKYNLKAVLEEIPETKREFASEIFAEIEFDIHQLMFERDETRAIAIEGIIAELKKKYTE